MKLRTVIVLLILCLLFPITAKADECVTVDDLAKSLATDGVVLRGSLPSASKRLVAAANSNRADAGRPPISAQILVAGYINDKDGPRIGVAFVDANGCLIQETVTSISVKQFVEFIQSAGVSPKEFVEVVPSKGA